MTVGVSEGQNDGKPDSAGNRLYRILMLTESAHPVWVLRCEGRIVNNDSPDHAEDAVRNRWHWKINERMQIDYLLTNIYPKKSRESKESV